MTPSALRWLVLVAALAPAVYYLLSIYSASRFFSATRRRRFTRTDFTPPVSILKPVRGLDREAYENYASFCRQDYPEYEILFGVGEGDDPAIPVIRKLISDFPECSIRLLIGTPYRGTNDKVRKLCRLVDEARYTLFVISDSDVRVEPDYLRRVAAPFRDPKVGGLTLLFRGTPTKRFGSELDRVGSASEFIAGAVTAWRLEGVRFALGSTMAAWRERLEEFGGFPALLDHHADDFEFGKRIAERGYRIEMPPEPVVWMLFPEQSFASYLRHELRWGIGLRHIRPWSHVGLIFSHGLPWAVAAAAVARSPWVASAYLAGYLALRLAMGWTVGVWGLRVPKLAARLLLLPVKDACAFFIWLASFFTDRVGWRGREFVVRDGLLVPADADAVPEPARSVERVS